MMTVALCDDDAAFLPELRKKIIQWYKGKEAVVVSEFTDSLYFSKIIRTNCYDLIFLDIEMRGVNGLRLAELIRAKMPHAIIIFLTCHNEFALDGYRVRALRYLPKLTLDKVLPEALEAAWKEFRRFEDKFLVIPYYTNLTRVSHREIVYVRHVLRRCEITTSYGKVLMDNRSLRDIYQLLNDERFLMLDRSSFVNLDYVRQIKESKVFLSTNEELAVSRKMLPKVKDTINRLWSS